jgi:fluoride ion exporter CrcB/FEX
VADLRRERRGRLRARLPDYAPAGAPAAVAYRRPFLGTGVCGALTTFSTVQIEVLDMLDHGTVGLAAGYVAASIGAGFLAVAAATNLVRHARLAS